MAKKHVFGVVQFECKQTLAYFLEYDYTLTWEVLGKIAKKTSIINKNERKVGTNKARRAYMDDVNILAGMLIAFFGLTAWYLNRAFLNLDRRFDAIDKKFEAMDKKFEAVDKKFEAVDKKFEAVDKKFEAVDKKFDNFKMEQNKKLDDFKTEQNKRLDDFKDFFKEILKTEFHYIHKEQAKIQLQLTNHVTQTDERIKNIEGNQKIMQKDLSEIKDLLKSR